MKTNVIKKIFISIIVLLVSFRTTEAARKVILDTDMAYLNDDALAMFVLTQADNLGMLDFIGVTTVGGNVFVAEATTAALRQLELIGRTDIPVYQGADEPLAGFRDMRKESKLYGMPKFCGAYWDFSSNDFADISKRPKNYLNLNKEPIHGYPTTRAKEIPAWDFIIESVKSNPGEVTIMSVGAATNIAHALKKYPELAKDAAGIIFMGGDIDISGNATKTAEMNWFYDPDAIKLCLSADWKDMIIVPDDLSKSIIITQEFYKRLAEKNNNEITKLILTNQKTFHDAKANYVWDVVVPIIFLKPELITNLDERYITVDNTHGKNSGKALTSKQNLNNGIKKGKIVMSIDTEAFWEFYLNVLTSTK